MNNGETCETCRRLRLHCLGFQDRRPEWLRSKENIKVWRKRVTDFLLSQGLVKGHAGCGLRPGPIPDASLTLEDMRRDLDAGVGDVDSPIGPLQEHERDLEPEQPLGFASGMDGPIILPPIHNIARQDSRDQDDPQYIPKRFENAIGGISHEDNRHRWVPPPPYPPLKPYDNEGNFLPPHPPGTRPPMNGFPLSGPMAPNPPGHQVLPSPTQQIFGYEPVRPLPPPHKSSGGYSSTSDSTSERPFTSPTGSTNESAYDNAPRNSSMYGYTTPALSSSATHSSSLPTPSSGNSFQGPSSEPGHSSGPDRYLPRNPYIQQDPMTGAHRRHEQFHPYRRGPILSRSPSGNGAELLDQLHIQTNTARGVARTSPTQYNTQSADSLASSSPEAYVPTYGSFSAPNAVGTYGGYVSSTMSIQSLLQASNAGTPVTVPPSSAISTVAPTPTTAIFPYSATNANNSSADNNNGALVTAGYFPTYPGGYPEYVPLLQSPPTMSLSEFYIHRYFTHVIGVQYRLANIRTLQHQMFELSERSPAVKASISLLSVLYLEAQQLAAAGIGGPLGDAGNRRGQGMILGENDSYSAFTTPYPPLDLGVPGIGLINASSMLPSNTTNSRAQYDLLYARIKKLLDEARLAKGGRYDEGDAMACLHVISAFLFSGGRGNWDQFLQIATEWVWAHISDNSGNVVAAISGMDSTSRFIFRTTMWMDVFGSISLCRTPRFINIYRTLFQPGALDSMTAMSVSVESRMESVMGCPNEVILAFAEIADLEAKKEALVNSFRTLSASQPREGWYGVSSPLERWQNDMAALEAEGRRIERYIPEALGPAALPLTRFQEIHAAPPPSSSTQQRPQASSSGSLQVPNQNLEFSGVDLNLFGGGPDPLGWFDPSGGVSSDMISGAAVEDENGGYIDPDEDMRGKIAEVFRNAARVYLHSVISGCDPLIPTTRRAVQATIRALQVLGATPLDRSLIFPLTITGCLAATQHEVDFCIGRLSSVGKDAESLGNCLAARQLIGCVWEKRLAKGFEYDEQKGVGTGGTVVGWREVMLELNRNPLLLV